jgi:cyclomaltodextrinase
MLRSKVRTFAALLLSAFSLLCGVCTAANTAPSALPQAAAPTATREVTLRYVAATPARTVTAAGSFNGWNKAATPLRRLPDGKTWEVTLSLAPGVYQYKFVIDDNTWEPDPNAPRIDDGNGNINSQLLLTPADYDRQPGMPGDGIITTSALRHMSHTDDIFRRDESRFALLLHTRHNDVQRCSLVWWQEAPKGGSGTRSAAPGRPTPLRIAPMIRSAADPLYDTWRGIVAMPQRGRIGYLFLVQDGSRSLLYGDRQTALPLAPGDATESLNSGAPALRMSNGFHLDPAQYPTLHVPDWPHDAVFYQVFPERFANGDPANDGPGVQPWGSKPTFDNRMGGDLAGVRQHLDYLQELGVNALYFNPIFTARSNHGYDTTDYLNVDPRFGDNRQLAALVAECHARRWHVILDGVFNHTGVDAAPFKSLREEGERSPYRNWYFVKGFPIEVKDGQQSYVGWFGSPWLPKLNLANPDTRRFMLGVGTYWLEQAGIDGWRLDAADEVSHDYWVDFRRRVRAVNPNAYIVGEIWGDARSWLQGDQFDSVMNYRWRGVTLDFFAQDKLSPTGFDSAMARIREDYPDSATDVMFNILDSHDTERIRNLCGGNWLRQRQATLFQLTYPGTPCIYYGDEIGLEGGRDPDDRRCMIWDRAQWRTEVLAFYKQALSLRRAHPALRRGDYRTVLAEDGAGLYAFTRTYGRERALIVFNRSDRPQQAIVPAEVAGNQLLQAWLPGSAPLMRTKTGLRLSLPARGIGVYGN